MAESFSSWKKVALPKGLDRVSRKVTLEELVRQLEYYHILEVYFWLSSKYELAFTDRNQVPELKRMLCERIENSLKLIKH
jgi:hypothetical protein